VTGISRFPVVFRVSSRLRRSSGPGNVVAKDGSREVAGSWVVGADNGHGKAANLDGSAAMAPGDVASVLVENTAGKKYVSASL
jgi:hypothetical protein